MKSIVKGNALTCAVRLAALTGAVICFIAALALTAFADSVNGISVSQAEAKPGDEIVLSVTLPPSENADTASLRIIYDDAAFDVLEWEPKVSGGYYSAGGGYILLSAANADRFIELGEGLTLSARLRVKDTAPDGAHSIEIYEGSFCYLDEESWDFIELWFPDITTASVTVDNPGVTAAAAQTTTAAETVQQVTEKAAVTSAAAPVAETAVSQAAQNGNEISPVMIYVIVGLAALLAAIVLMIFSLRKKPEGTKNEPDTK